MVTRDPSRSSDEPRSAETVAIVEIDTPPGSAAVVVVVAEGAPDVQEHTELGATTAIRQVSLSPASAAPRTSRPRITRILFFAALLACLGWGIVEIQHWMNIKPKPPRAGGTTHSVDPTSSESSALAIPEQSDPAVLDDEADDATYPGLRAQSFLHTRVRKDQKDGEGPIVELAASGAIAPQAITVVNLWATWCGPCRAEFAGFKRMFELNRRDQGWGAETRFVPILVDDAENVRTAYATYSGDMPSIHVPLIDLKLDGGGVRGSFSDIKLSPDAGLPITLLFDCRRRLRWSKSSALDEAAFNTLADEIDKLRAELRQEKCKIKRPNPADLPAPGDPPTDPTRKSPCNQNGVCDPSEDCGRCPRECRCKDDEKCNIRPDGHGVCKETI